jgi:molybdopterin-guanine dinucleotide biosynthesis protein MobB
MNVLALSGPSGSGKTTAIEGLIRHFVAKGKSVGAIKHTHHEVSIEDRGDTRRFRAAGAEPVVLAGERKAAVFRNDDVAVTDYAGPEDLIALFSTDIVLVEGFKHEMLLRKIELRAGEWMTVDELVARAGFSPE